MKSLFQEEVSLKKSLVAVILLALGFIILNTSVPINFFSIILFGLIGTVVVFGPKGIFRIFSKPNKGAFKLILISVLLSYIINLGVGIIGKFVLNQPNADNPIRESLSHGLASSAMVLFKTIFQLAGEEIIVLLPLIIIVALLVKKAHINQTVAVVIATILTALMFGAIHLQTYQWNLFQCFVVVALTRLPFTIVSLKSNSIITGLIGHIIYDWIIFGFMIATALGVK